MCVASSTIVWLVTGIAVLSAASGCGDGPPRATSDSVGVVRRADVRAPVASSIPRADSVAPRRSVPAGTRTDRPARTAGTRAATPRHVVIEGVDLTGVGYDRGDPAAPVVVVDLSDFACPYCGEFARETYPDLEAEYVTKGTVFFKYVPFVAGTFPHSREATRAAECAAEQGQFWTMFDRIYATQADWRRGNAVDAQMAALAAAVGTDSGRFSTCYHDHHTDARTTRATDVANGIGVRVTPSFVVNGRPIQGALPWGEFRTVIEAALMVTRIKR